MAEPSSPPHQHDWDLYAGVADAILKGRAEGYGKLVDEKRLTQAEADRRIAIMRACAEIWHAAWECRRPDPAILGNFDRCDIIAELDRAREITAKRLARDPNNGGARYQVEQIDAMIRWHTRRFDATWCVSVTLAWREQVAAEQQRKAA